jgi:pimeloyl-ACP methyl ester carboxylesterase
MNPNKLHTQAYNAVLSDMADEFKYDQFDLVAHSMGGYTAVNLAKNRPEQIRSITFIASAGLEPKDFPTMLGRAANFLYKEALPARDMFYRNGNHRVGLGTAHYIFRNLPRTVAEGVQIATCDIGENIRSLGKLGVKTAAIQFKNDTFFPLDEIRGETKEIFDDYHEYDDPDAQHITPQLDPVGVSQVVSGLISKITSAPAPVAAA